jgi:hypothetical protein
MAPVHFGWVFVKVLGFRSAVVSCQPILMTQTVYFGTAAVEVPYEVNRGVTIGQADKKHAFLRQVTAQHARALRSMLW